MKKVFGLLFGVLMLSYAFYIQGAAVQKAPPANGTPVQMIVTVEAQHGNNIPELAKQDVVVSEGSNRDAVTGWVPLTGNHAGMDLFILLDDASNTDIGLQFGELRKFINSQPATTHIGVGYMRNGDVDTEQNFTSDHAAAAKAFRPPMGTPGNNPYFSLQELIKRWPQQSDRREILMVSNGIDPGEGNQDPYRDSVIEQAQKNRILIYSIYTTAVGFYGHDFRRIDLGQNNLSRLAGETGAEAWFQGFHTPISFAPFLAELSGELDHQYLLTFLARPGERAGFRSIRLETEVPNAELITADRAYIPSALAHH